MRFGESLNIIAIAEWKECYINYEVLKIFVTIIKEIVEAIVHCQEIIHELVESEENQISDDNYRLAPSIVTDLVEIRETLKVKLKEQNELFYQIYITQSEIIELFYQMKVLQMKQRYDICTKLWSRKVKKELIPIFLTYIEYSYIQISYISEMREANREAERKILKKHKKYAAELVATPQPNYIKIDRIACYEEDYINKIENLYAKVHSDMAGKQAREFLRESVQRSEISFSDCFLFGVGVGATAALLCTLIFIIVHQDLSIENTSAAFSRDFPAWRGIAIFILYIWILGFNVYCFERFKISHRLIFKFNDHHYSSSSSIFKIAGFFTALFMVVFLIYLLLITKIIRNSINFQSEYLVLIVWIALGIYLLMPLPIFNYEGRLYAIKLMFRSLVSPIMGVDFTIIWMTDQWISLATPLRDFAYTICYYNYLDFQDLKVNPCKDHYTFQVSMLVVVIAISYKILQCFRMGYQEGKFFMTTYMANAIKFFVSLVTAILSYVYNLGYPNLLGIWIITSFASTIYSYYWDLKYDWVLLEPNCKYWLLRKYITFEPKRNYYIVIVANFIMRLSWMMTISPNVALYFGNSSLLTLITGAIEIIRRGIWNLLRVEKQHLKNCNEFKAIPDMKHIQNRLQAKVTQMSFTNDEIDKTGEEARELIKKSYISLIKKKIEERDQTQKCYNEIYLDLKLKAVKENMDRIKQLGRFKT